MKMIYTDFYNILNKNYHIIFYLPLHSSTDGVFGSYSNDMYNHYNKCPILPAHSSMHAVHNSIHAAHYRPVEEKRSWNLLPSTTTHVSRPTLRAFLHAFHPVRESMELKHSDNTHTSQPRQIHRWRGCETASKWSSLLRAIYRCHAI